MVLADADEVDAKLIGEHGLLDQIADDLCRVQRLAVWPVGDVTEGVEAEFDRLSHSALSKGIGETSPRCGGTRCRLSSPGGRLFADFILLLSRETHFARTLRRHSGRRRFGL